MSGFIQQQQELAHLTQEWLQVGQRLAQVLGVNVGTVSTRNIGSRKPIRTNAKRVHVGEVANANGNTTATVTAAELSGQAQKLVSYTRESGGVLVLKQAPAATGIPYHSVAKLCGQLVKHNIFSPEGRGVYRLNS